MFAKKILDTTTDSIKQRFSILLVCNDIEKETSKLLSAFEGAQIEPAFYPDRYALHISASNTDENLIKLEIYERWKALDTDAKILFMAPIFYKEADKSKLSDFNYENPIQAFEGGFYYAKETNKC